MSIRTFEEFHATGRDVADLRTIPHIAAQLADDGGAVQGRVYGDDDLFIERYGHRWSATWLNDSRLFNDEMLAARFIWDNAVAEGLFPDAEAR